jgi:uncharacterized repeat protein (TIGR01451 family)
MYTFKTVFIYWAKKFLFVLGMLALIIPFPQMASASNPPELNVSGSVTYFLADDPVLVAPELTLTGDNIDSVQVSIIDNFASGDDYLGIQGETGTSGTLSGIDWSYSTATGIMNLQNNASASTYQSVLRQITYYSTSGILSATTRTIGFSIGSSLYCADTGHYYEYVASSGISWDDAVTAAAWRSYFGLQGYLATVTSQAENDFINSKLEGDAWMGAADSATESRWCWVTGPEAGTYFFHQTAAAGNSVHLQSDYGNTIGSGGEPAISGQYNKWADGQPDDYCDYGSVAENYAHFYKNDYYHTGGTWNDYPDDNGYGSGIVLGYVVEFGGMAGDPNPQLTGNVTVNIYPSADLSITKTGNPDPVMAGSVLTYTITAKNDGPSDATGVSVNDTLPSGLTFKSANTHGKGTYNSGAGVWSGFGLASGDSATLTLQVTVNSPLAKGTVITNEVTVIGNEHDPDTDNNTASRNTSVYFPRGIGGEFKQTSKFTLITPWLILVFTLMVGGITLVLNRRKGS